MQQHRTIEAGDAGLECTIRGSGVPVVLLANAGCGTGYFDPLAVVLAAEGFQTISIDITLRIDRVTGAICTALSWAWASAA